MSYACVSADLRPENNLHQRQFNLGGQVFPAKARKTTSPMHYSREELGPCAHNGPVYLPMLKIFELVG